VPGIAAATLLETCLVVPLVLVFDTRESGNWSVTLTWASSLSRAGRALATLRAYCIACEAAFRCACASGRKLDRSCAGARPQYPSSDRWPEGEEGYEVVAFWLYCREDADAAGWKHPSGVTQVRRAHSTVFGLHPSTANDAASATLWPLFFAPLGGRLRSTYFALPLPARTTRTPPSPHWPAPHMSADE